MPSAPNSMAIPASSGVSAPPGGEEVVVASVGVADAGEDGQSDRLGIEAFGGGGSADPARVLPAGVLGDSACLVLRAPRVEVGNVSCEFSDEDSVDLGSPDGRLPAALRSLLGVGAALLLRSLEGFFLNEDALALVALSGPGPLHDHGPQAGVLAGAARQCSIAPRQVHEVVEIRALEALGPVLDRTDPGAAAQLLTAEVALGLAAGHEHDDVVGLPAVCGHGPIMTSKKMDRSH